MNPIRQIFEDAPASIPLPQELHHRRVELILWPLDEAPEETGTVSERDDLGDYERTRVDKIEIPSREERMLYASKRDVPLTASANQQRGAAFLRALEGFDAEFIHTLQEDRKEQP
jgi:hypothetical protein